MLRIIAIFEGDRPIGGISLARSLLTLSLIAALLSLTNSAALFLYSFVI
jgi:hypothetical protein